LIQTKNLTKKYGNFTAVNNVNLHIPAGQIYGFLGPNGAGKTTTILMMLGIIRPTAGEIFLFDEKYTQSRLDMRKAIGVVPEKHPRGMWKWMTAFEYLAFFGALFEIDDPEERIRDLLDKVGLLAMEKKPLMSFSHGMLQKISIIRALLHDPDILFLDEPISGLDPIGIKSVRDLIVSENREGRTILVSSHILSEMEKICHRVGILLNGSLIAEDDMEALIQKITRHKEIEIELEALPVALPELFKSESYVLDCFPAADKLIVRVPLEGDYRKRISEFLIQNKVIPLGIREKALTLEEAFTTITQENVRLFANTGEM